MSTFTLDARDDLARAGTLRTRHGDVPTPAFMPVGTQAAVKGLVPDELRAAGATMILSNAYHCYLRPGASIVAQAGGLHEFMAWRGPILTDSGGFQIMSLARLSDVDDDGYHFASHLDGSRHTFTPESVVELQERLGSDVAMVLDDLVAAGVDDARVRQSSDRTLRWAERSLAAKRDPQQLTFAIVQGSTLPEVRRANARSLVALDFPGYAIGGLWVGERKETSHEMVGLTCAELPDTKPRYLMGVGTPEDLLACVGDGVDLFDCVYPTRCARHALALTAAGKLNLRNARFATDFGPLDERCGCAACATFSRAYLAHCFRAGEAIAPRMVSLHNVTFMTRLAADARVAILRGGFAAWRNEVLSAYGQDGRP
ncbi:MAG TPA: tRNA guanosine(34) transglycosylase Tgt [Candidatus Eremiobacteraceae bacterium]|nr:tRNA guanosine(34) transglycosylase Tgt [Candidatus Eremiobacteraceae bacterium]